MCVISPGNSSVRRLHLFSEADISLPPKSRAQSNKNLSHNQPPHEAKGGLTLLGVTTCELTVPTYYPTGEKLIQSYSSEPRSVRPTRARNGNIFDPHIESGNQLLSP
ncbi:hypothetical protein TNIN_488251 [Trichonephila inaurata madagascariensis]|uniref:Uncharacterized protein n=1 Tax=Trichonephila inaurata madagascariensis TaxID=2747483 RepID=A0A8X7C1L6_9ARAC|nr:hypothetical protein TNIN_488251 [Trichonephila inaurata madagascariensis]